MHDLSQITAPLTRLFVEEDQRIVFWNDPDREFEALLPSICLEGVTILRLDRVGSLAAKIRLERDEPHTKFLLYSPAKEPEYDRDWLLDIRLYSRSFRADRASSLLQELGLGSLNLRGYLATRRKFFDSKDRLQKLKRFVAADDTEADLDRKMIAVIAREEQPEFFVTLRTILHAYAERDGEIDLETPPSAWEQVEKFELDAAFFRMARESFAYEDENPNLKSLLFRLFLTDFAYHLQGALPPPLQPFVLPRPGWENAVVCMAQWRDSSSRATSYDRLAAEVARAVRLADQLPALDSTRLVDVMTFLDVEKRVVSGLRDLVVSTAEAIDPDEVRAVATRRRSGHWANDAKGSTPDAPRRELNAVYDALVAAADFHALKARYGAGFDTSSSASFYRAYITDVFRFDQLYRHFCEAADAAEKSSWDVLKPLRALVEQAYVNWYLPALAMSWGKLLEPPDGLLSTWRIPEVVNQYDFFHANVRHWIDKDDARRAFVIISDGLRFEAAEELASELNGKYRLQATLDAQLGVLPSYTTLGMASLLPHTTLAYRPSGEVLADGKPTSSTEQRDAVLRTVCGMAIQSKDLLEKKKDEGRELIRDRRVVYIYHNTIDATGDAAGSEHKTFEAVRQAIDELAAVVGYVVNNLNGHHVLVTADHGFLFTESAPTGMEKTKLADTRTTTIKEKKRYVLGLDLPGTDAAWSGQTRATARAEGGVGFWIPKGVNRFHFAGGARYVHGGAMPQEIVVPVLTVKHVRGKSTEHTRIRPASVQVLGSHHRITTGQHRFQLIQMDAISDRVKPATLKVAVYEGATPVTNVETVTFDSASDSMEDRKKWIRLVLQDRPYDKRTPFRLILRDQDDIEQTSVDVVIDRAFNDDF